MTGGKKLTVKSSNTSTSVKNVYRQKTVVRNYLEQRLESQGYRRRVKCLLIESEIRFQIREGTICTIRDGTICVWDTPIKKFNGSKPLKFESVDADSIKIQQATCCKRCHTWKKPAPISRCQCGGYLVPRKRFHTKDTESWDAEFLEIQTALKDARISRKIDSKPRRKKQYIPTGITTARRSSVDIKEEPKLGVILIPKGDDIIQIPETRDTKQCSLLFKATISQNGKTLRDAQKLGLLKKYNLEPIDVAGNDSFRKESRQYIKAVAPDAAQELMDSWNHSAVPSQITTKAAHRKRGSSSSSSFGKDSNQDIFHVKKYNLHSKRHSKRNSLDPIQSLDLKHG